MLFVTLKITKLQNVNESSKDINVNINKSDAETSSNRDTKSNECQYIVLDDEILENLLDIT